MPHHPAHSSSHPRSPPQATTTATAAAAATASAIPTSIPDNRLGLSPQDVATLRQHQQLAHAQARSPAGSQASSQGRLLLDPGSLQMLAQHFDRVMQAIGQRLDQVRFSPPTFLPSYLPSPTHARFPLPPPVIIRLT